MLLEFPLSREREQKLALPRRIVIVEDNETLAKGLANNLEIEGYHVTVAHDAASGLESIQRVRPDLVILDLMLPDTDGSRLLMQLRQAENDVRVLILTARSEEADKVLGFRYGADDYVTKPFGLLELLGRVKALLRRSVDSHAPESDSDADVISFGDVEVCISRHTVTLAGTPVLLRPKEFLLLVAIAKRRGAVVSKRTLLEEVWGYNQHVMSRTVDTHIGEIRRKIESDPAQPTYLLTVRKSGYRLGP